MCGAVPFAPTNHQLQAMLPRMGLTLDGSLGCFQHERGDDTSV